MYKSFLNKTSVRGLRNNNPGNIIYSAANAWQGKIPLIANTDTNNHFEQFTELRYGLRALMQLIINKIDKGQSTIFKLITSYAPAFENNTVAYMNTVAKMVGIGINVPINNLSEDILIGLVKAIVLVEIGKDYISLITETDYKDALAILGKTKIAITKKKVTP